MVALAVSSLAAGLTCGDDDSAGGFAAAYCDLLKPCCAMANLRTDGKQCQLFFGAFVGGAKFNTEAGDACLAATRALSSRPDFCKNLDAPETAACEKVFEQPGGSKQPGETCTDAFECAKSTEGEVDCETEFGPGGAQVRKCQLAIRGKEGDKPCVGTKEEDFTSRNLSLDDVPARGYLCDTADGLRCDTTNHTCVKLKPAGEPCTSSSTECVRTAYCDTAADRCTDRKSPGAACTSASFSNEECAAGNWCGPARICAAQVANGAACTAMQECQSENCLNMKCEPNSDLGLAFVCGAP